MLKRDPSHYCAYLLRCWREPEPSLSAWRFSLEDPHTGERLAFATFEALIIFLDRQLSDESSDFQTAETSK